MTTIVRTIPRVPVILPESRSKIGPHYDQYDYPYGYLLSQPKVCIICGEGQDSSKHVMSDQAMAVLQSRLGKV